MSAGLRAPIGYVMFLVGVVACLAAGALLVSTIEPTRSIWFLFGGIAVVMVGAGLVMFSTSFLVPTFDQVARVDKRPPVLFLRPFEEDASRTYDVISTGETTTFEQATADDFLIALNALGPLVSIGKPDWKSRLGMYPGGAYRIVDEAGRWQEKVVELMQQARLVVLAVGESPGIEWEIEAVKEHVPEGALLLYLPPRPISTFTSKGREKKERKLYEAFKTLIESRLPVHLPEFKEAVYIIGFDKDGEPIISQNPANRWWWLQKARISNQIFAQLKHVLGVVAPESNLSSYTVIGQRATNFRYSAAFLLFLAGLGVGWLSHTSGYKVWLDPYLIFQIGRVSFVGLALVAGWVLIAKHFGKRWVWIIPACHAVIAIVHILVTLVQMSIVAAPDLRWVFMIAGQITAVVSMLSAGLILLLGVWLHSHQRRAAAK